MNRVTQKLDLERVALDAYSVVWEPSRKQVRDHQRAAKAAVAAVLLHLSDTWAAVPEYQTNGHVQQTVGEFGGRLLIAATDLLGAGEDDDLHALLSGEDRSEPTPAPREPRVWQQGDPEPGPDEVGLKIRDRFGRTFYLERWTGTSGWWCHELAEIPEDGSLPGGWRWHTFLGNCAPLTEVLSEVVTPEGPA